MPRATENCRESSLAALFLRACPSPPEHSRECLTEEGRELARSESEKSDISIVRTFNTDRMPLEASLLLRAGQSEHLQSKMTEEGPEVTDSVIEIGDNVIASTKKNYSESMLTA